MRILHLADRLSLRGGADQHLRAVLEDQAARHEVALAVGRVDPGVQPPPGVRLARVRGLEALGERPVDGSALDALLEHAEVHHLHNVMNPGALRRVLARGRGLVTVQDHRVFCPGPGRTLPDGARCGQRMGERACAGCLEDPALRAQRLTLTEARLAALQKARAVVVLSAYMARELAQAGLPGAEVIPPWVDAAPRPAPAGWGFVLGGRLVSHKAPELGWAGWTLAGRPQPLRVAGAGALEGALEGAERLGWLDQGDLRALLRQSRALVFAARWQEPFGILGVQAQAEGVPVVVAAGGGTEDWAGQGALRVEPRAEAIAGALRTLHADPGLAGSLGAQGWTQARERFARAPLSAALERITRAVAESQPG